MVELNPEGRECEVTLTREGDAPMKIEVVSKLNEERNLMMKLSEAQAEWS